MKIYCVPSPFVKNSEVFSGDANMWYEHHPYKMETVGSTPTSTTIYNRRKIMELIMAIYCLIGIILGAERLSRVTKEDDSSMVCIGIMAIIVLWPLYIVYKIVKNRRNK